MATQKKKEDATPKTDAKSTVFRLADSAEAQSVNEISFATGNGHVVQYHADDLRAGVTVDPSKDAESASLHDSLSGNPLLTSAPSTDANASQTITVDDKVEVVETNATEQQTNTEGAVSRG